MKARTAFAAALLVALAIAAPARAQEGRGGPPPAGPPGPAARRGGPPPTGQQGAPIDLTGNWVSVVTEDWRYRMITPAKGDYNGVPMTAEARKVADAWDPAADEKAGVQCRSYGAAAIMRVPGRLRISWSDPNTLRVDTDAGMQTRLFHFRPWQKSAGHSWQGDSSAEWQTPRAGRGQPGAPPPRPTNGSLKVMTTNLESGYLRKNGVPYSQDATVTEYFGLAHVATGLDVMVVTTVVNDPKYLTQPFVVSSQFKREADGSKWDPTPCSSTW